MHPAPLRFSSVEYCRYAPSSRLRWTVRGIDIDGPRCVTVLMTRTTETPAPSQSSRSATRYSPHIRTALVLTGTGTAGAYHAGVLRALHEAGVKVDLVAGRGIGAVGAAFAAVDGASQLWEPAGLWSATGATRLYHWRPALRAVAWILGVALGALVLPLGVVVLAALVYPLSYLLGVVGLAGGDWLTSGFGRLVEWVFVPAVLPTWLPRLIVVALALLLGVLVCAAGLAWMRARAQRRPRGALWWVLLGAPLDVGRTRGWLANGLWTLMRGAASIARPGPEDLGQRYSELLSENLGQPGFRELLTTAHDLDGRRDLVFALLSEPYRRRFFQRRVGETEGDRDLEALDLAGGARRHGFDALAAALSLPVATEPWLVRFSSGSSWRGETHRVCDRPDAIGRLLDEVAQAGAEQVILVSALPGPTGPHALGAGRRDGRGRIGEALSAIESAAVRDAITSRAGLFQAVFEIHPVHNPLGPFDFAGCYDERSDREQSLAELMERGYDDGHRQFVGPVVGASGEQIKPLPRPRTAARAPGRDE